MNLLPIPYEERRVILLDNPFTMQRTMFYVSAGKTIREIVYDTVGKRSAIVLVDDLPVPEKSWNVIPVSGQQIIVRAIPTGGGGGGGGGKDPLRTVLMLSVAVASLAIGNYVGAAIAGELALGEIATQIAIAATTAATMAVGSMLINAIAPPTVPSLSARAMPSISSGVSGSASRTNLERSPSLSGGKNQSNRYGPVPRVLGTHKIIPPYGADAYTEILGADQYLRMLFVLGYGPLSVSDLKIGETSIDDFSGVEYEIREGYDDDEDVSLYSDDVDEEVLNIQLKQSNGWNTRTTEQNTDEITFDIVFPTGLIEYVENRAENQTNYVNQETGEIYAEGELLPPEVSRTVTIEWAYSVTGENSWTTGQITTTAKSGTTIRKGHKISVTNGQYDVRLRRVTADTSSSRIIDDVYWTTLRSIHKQDPINLSGIAKVAVRIKATDQLQGVVDTFSCICSALIDDYDSDTDTWLEEQVTSNPASIYREVLQGIANKRALSDDEIDLDNLAEWHIFCDTNGFTYNQVIDYKTSVSDLLNEIASAGRAAPAMIDGKYGVVWDREQSTPVQHFSPRNSWGFTGRKEYLDFPHAFRVLFPNADKDYRQDERVVYDDGYDSDNATVIEQLELPGVTDSDLAWKHGRYHIAVARLRPEVYTFFADVENLACTRGDLIRVSHDVPLWGLGYGRVKEVQDDGTYATGVTVDNAMTMEENKTYNIRFRKSDGSTLLLSIDTNAGSQTTMTFSSPPLIADGPEAGDLALFGETGLESVELLVKSIEPGSDLTAKLTCIDYSPGIYDADTGTIPSFDSQITLPADVLQEVGTPIIDTIKSGESVLVRGTDGVLRPRILITFQYRKGRLFDQIIETQTEYRKNGLDEPWERVTLSNYVNEVSLQDVGEGETYDLRCRYRIYDGRVSGWTSTRTHTVVGKSTLPPDVPRLFVDANEEYLHWSYTNVPKDMAGFRIRHRSGVNRKWADASPAHSELIKATRFPLSSIPSGSGIQTIMIKAEDVAGNQSENVTAIVLNLGDALVDNIIVSNDLSSSGYPGTITNGTVDGTDLKADGIGTTFWSDADSKLFWSDDESNMFWTGGYLRMVYVSGREQGRLFWSGTDGNDFWNDDDYLFWRTETVMLTGWIPEMENLPGEISLEYTITGNPYWISYRTSGGELFWEGSTSAVFWNTDSDIFWSGPDDWEEWPGKVTGKRQRYEFQVVTAAGKTRGVISEFTIQLDVPDIEEYVNDESIDMAGTRLTLTETYRSIESVQLTLQDDGGDAVYAKVMDKSVSGPLIKCYDSAGDLTSGSIDAHVQGY